MRVGFLDAGDAYRELSTELDAAYGHVMASGRYLLGRQLEAFEREFARYVGASDCAGVGSGFDALVLGLRAVGVSPGDDVLVPTNTITLTWSAVSTAGARPIGVEPDQTTLTIDPEGLERACTPRTTAVVPVHLYGRPADMEAISVWARKRGVKVLADAAQAHGARIGGTPIGSFGDAAAWSFYPTKNLGGFADGGAVTSCDTSLTDRVRLLRNYGSHIPGEVLELGANSRLDELQSAFLRVRLSRLDEWNRRRREVAEFYTEALDGIGTGLPPHDNRMESAWHLYVVRVPDRERIRASLLAEGVETMVHYPVPPFVQPVFTHLGIQRGAFPFAERLADEVLSLPCGPHLQRDQAEHVVESVRAALRL